MSFGLERERKVVRLLQAQGYLVASLRHYGCPGDLLALRGGDKPLIVEVKGTRDFPWKDYKGFGRPRRQELIDVGERHHAEVLLCWWPPYYGPFWIESEEWPGTVPMPPQVRSAVVENA
jgi:Holliday junction resolvase